LPCADGFWGERAAMKRDGVEAAAEPRGEERRLLKALRSVFMAVVPGALLGVSTVGFIYVLVFGYYVFTPEAAERQVIARELATGWAPSLFFVLGVCVLAFRVGWWVRARGVRLGLLVGLSAAGAEQTLVYFEYPPVVPNELLAHTLLGICAGAFGGWWSVWEVARAETGERALFDETVNIARADDPDRVAEAIGALMGRERVAGVAVWRTTPFGRERIGPPTGAWEAGGVGTFRAAVLLEAAGRRARERDTAANLMADTLGPGARSIWAEAGVRSAFAGPLICMGGESLGFFFVGFGKTTLLTGTSRRRVLSVAAAAGLALEKLAAVGNKREQDRQFGIMEERERVSREIHDSLIQCLAGVVMELNGAEKAEEVGAVGMVWHHVERAREAARRATDEARRLVWAMRPEILNGSSLPEALGTLARRTSEESGIEVTSEIIGEVRPLSPKAEHALTRIAQEALSNVCKHSAASRATLSLDYGHGRVVLEVIDDGTGMQNTPEHAGTAGDAGFGMRSMRERAERLGGRLLVKSSKGMGTKVIVDAPTRDEGE
jgi:signal transduction histidine kinase